MSVDVAPKKKAFRMSCHLIKKIPFDESKAKQKIARRNRTFPAIRR